jgi:hypothetical protein
MVNMTSLKKCNEQNDCNAVSEDESCGICLNRPSRRRKLFSICNICNGNSCLQCWSQLLKITNPSTNDSFEIKCPFCRTIIQQTHLERTPLWNSNAHCRQATRQYQLVLQYLRIDIQNYKDISENATTLLKDNFYEYYHFLTSHQRWVDFTRTRPNDINADVQQAWLRSAVFMNRDAFE